MHRAALHAVTLLLLLLLQGPALLVQEIAWVSMLMRYSLADGVTTGITKTFDGKHPCRLCHQAEALRQTEDQRDEAPGDATLKSRLHWAEMLNLKGTDLDLPFGQPAPAVHFAAMSLPISALPQGPPTPPPKS